MKPKAYKGTEPYIFASYAHADSDRVLPIIAKMQKKGFRIWFDSGIEAGAEWPRHIAERLEQADGVIIFMSNAAANSKNCRREITLAVEKEVDPIVVYLEETELSAGMKLQLSNIQALFAHRLKSKSKIVKQLCSAECLKRTKPASMPFWAYLFASAYVGIPIVLGIMAVVIVASLIFCWEDIKNFELPSFWIDDKGIHVNESSESQITTEHEGDEQKTTLTDRLTTALLGDECECDSVIDIYYRKSTGCVYSFNVTFTYDYSKYPEKLKTPEQVQELTNALETNIKANSEGMDFLTSRVAIHGNSITVNMLFDKLDVNANAKQFAQKYLKSYAVCADALDDDYSIVYEKMLKNLEKDGMEIK